MNSLSESFSSRGSLAQTEKEIKIYSLDFFESISSPREEIPFTNFSLTEIGKEMNTTIFQVVSKNNTKDYKFAAKIASISNENADNSNGLHKEAKILKKVARENVGFPHLIEYAKKDNHEILLMSLLGPNLDTLHKMCNSKFSLKTTLLLGIQIIERLEVLHSHGWIHQDIRARNFAIGDKEMESSTIFLTNYDFAKKYVDENKKHLPFNKTNKMVASLDYSSVFGHLGIETSRRDDLISLCYMLINLFKGQLPWINVQGKTEERAQKIFQLKATIKDEVLCEGLPKEFIEFYGYVTTLPFYQKPDYIHLVTLFQKMLENIGAKEDGMFDWVKPEAHGQKIMTLEKGKTFDCALSYTKAIDLEGSKIMKKGIDLSGRKIMTSDLQSYKKSLDDTFEDLVFDSDV